MRKKRPRYAPEFRRQMVELVRAGRSPAELADEFEPTAQSIHKWVAQADRDEGRRSDGLTFDANPILKGNSTIVHWTSANASTLSLATLGSKTPDQSGSSSVSPTQTTDYSGAVTGAGGASGSCPATLSVQCTPASTYTCSANNIVHTSTTSQCAVTTTNPYATCVAPAFCSAGSAACLYPPPSPVPDAPNTLSGHLQARPTIVKKGKTIRIFWNISNVSSCTVTGTNGDTWSGATSGTSGKTSATINQQTVYTLSCTALDSSTYQESTTVNLVPAYQER
jgi:hypothetical protein